MAILPEPLFDIYRGAQISTEPSLRSMPPATMAPQLLLTGLHFIHKPEFPIHDVDAMDTAVCPGAGKLFDYLRPWGAIRLIRTRIFPRQGDNPSPADCGWNAVVEFWYEQDAMAFQCEYNNNTERVIEGWRMYVMACISDADNDDSHVTMEDPISHWRLMAAKPHFMPCEWLSQVSVPGFHQSACSGPAFLALPPQARHGHNGNLQNGVAPWTDRCNYPAHPPGSVNTPYAEFSHANIPPASHYRQSIVIPHTYASTSLARQQAVPRSRFTRRPIQPRKTALKQDWRDIATDLPGGGIQANGVRASDGTSILHGESLPFHYA